MNMEQSFLTVADSHLKLGEFKEAEEYYKKVLEYNSKSSDAFIGLFLTSCGFASLGVMLENADSQTLLSALKSKYFAKAQKFASEEMHAKLSEFAEKAKARAVEVKAFEEQAKRLENAAEKRAKEIAKFYETEGSRILACRKCGAELQFFDELTEIGERAFEGIKSLKSVELPEEINYIGDEAFCGCKNLEEVKIARTPDYMGDGVFADCVNLFKITLPKDCKYIRQRTFWNCRSLEEAEIPPEVKIIGASAFDGCNGLSDIKIPEKVEKIGDYAFYGCESVEEIIIPESVREIGKAAFEGCGLNKVTMPKRFKKHRKKIFGKKIGGFFSKVRFEYI